jgi:hypothetical protein
MPQYRELHHKTRQARARRGTAIPLVVSTMSRAYASPMRPRTPHTRTSNLCGRQRETREFASRS